MLSFQREEDERDEVGPVLNGLVKWTVGQVFYRAYYILRGHCYREHPATTIMGALTNFIHKVMMKVQSEVRTRPAVLRVRNDDMLLLHLV